MSLIEVRDLVVRLGGSTVIEGLSFDVEVGELLCVIGPSGCGKTTLLRALGGLVPPTSGEVRVAGEPAEVRRRMSELAAMGVDHVAIVPWLADGQDLERFIRDLAGAVLS